MKTILFMTIKKDMLIISFQGISAIYHCSMIKAVNIAYVMGSKHYRIEQQIINQTNDN